MPQVFGGNKRETGSSGSYLETSDKLHPNQLDKTCFSGTFLRLSRFAVEVNLEKESETAV